jgi:transposase
LDVLVKYHDKNVIEKSFDNVKNLISMKKMRTLFTNVTDGIFFCAFLALKIVSELGVKLSKFLRNPPLHDARYGPKVRPEAAR